MALDKFADEVFISGLEKTTACPLYRHGRTTQALSKSKIRRTISVLSSIPLTDLRLSMSTLHGLHYRHLSRAMSSKKATMVAALYFLYGPLTILTYTTGKGVHEFFLDESGEFVLKQQDIRIPEEKFTHPALSGRITSRLMHGGLNTSSRPDINFVSADVLSPTCTRYSIREEYSPIPGLKGRKREN